MALKHIAIAVTEVALKIPLEESPDIEKIRREALVWEKAKGHPNVLPIMDADVYDGVVVIVSEYAAEGSMEDALRRHGGRRRTSPRRRGGWTVSWRAWSTCTGRGSCTGT